MCIRDRANNGKELNNDEDIKHLPSVVPAMNSKSYDLLKGEAFIQLPNFRMHKITIPLYQIARHLLSLAIDNKTMAFVSKYLTTAKTILDNIM